MATGQTGRNCAQMHCTTASGTLTSEQQQKRKRKKAFRRSSEMQTAGPEDVAWAEAFTQVVRYCAENNKQIRLVWEVKGVPKWRHAVHREIRENEDREPFRGGRHPYWYQGETECCYIPVNCRKHLGTVFKICQGKRQERKKWSIQIAAKLLPVNINNTETSKSTLQVRRSQT